MTFQPDDSPRFGVFTLRTECPRCGAHLPANGPGTAIACASCEAEVDVPRALVGELFERFEDTWPNPAASDAETLGDLTWRWTAAPCAGPTCDACGEVVRVWAALEPGDKLDRRKDPRDVCACGVPLHSLPMPPAIWEIAPSAARVYGSDGDGPIVSEAAPVAMACPQCGAGLTITHTHQRISPCGHCGVTIHLPDAIWRALHPPRTVRPWIVCFDGESRPARADRRARELGEAVRKKEEREAQQKAERAEAKARGMREQEARKREEEEAARAEKEAKRAAEEAAEKRRRLLLTPVLLGNWVFCGGAAVTLALSAAWYSLGPLNVLVPYASPAFWINAPRPVMLLASGAAGVAWMFAHGAVALRARQRLVTVLGLGVFYGVILNIPMVSPVAAAVFGWLYLNGREPTEAQAKGHIPFLWRLPAVAMIGAFAVSHPAMYAAIGGIPVFGLNGMLEQFFN